MGCFGSRYKEGEVKAAQKWDYINLNDFRSSSCFTPISYGVLWIMLGVSVACYVADFSTMLNLALWDNFSSIAPPKISGSQEIPRWTFTGCIILSYVLLVYRWIKAIRAMRSGGVAKCYLDPLAARVLSVRPGKRGRGYRRFLVFAELTKSKHGTEYIALFVHFAFEAWVRIIFAEAPRNAINAYTIYTMAKAWADEDNSPDKNDADSGIQKFFAAAGAQASQSYFQTAVFFGMLFTIIIWVIAFIGLVVAFILYVMFLWHHIPKQDGGLRGYCKRKVDKSVAKIVSAKIKKALEKEEGRDHKKDGKGKRDRLPEAPADLKRQPTVPVFGDEESAILPPYGARSETPSSMLDREPTLPGTGSMSSRPGMPGRTATGTSAASYGSDAPLLSGAAEFGDGQHGRSYSPAPGGYPGRPYSPANGRSASPAPSRPFTPTGELITGRSASAPQRSMTPTGGPQRPPMGANGPQRSFTPAGPPPFQNGGRPGGPMRQNTDFSTGRASPAPSQSRQLTPGPGLSGMGPRSASAMGGPNNGRYTPMGPPPRSNTAGPYNPQGRQSPAPFNRPGPYNQRGPGRETPVQEFEMTPQPRVNTSQGGYQAYQPSMQSPSSPGPVDRPLLGHAPMNGMHRSDTAPIPHQDSTYGNPSNDHYADDGHYTSGPVQRSATFGPMAGSGSRWQ